MAILHIRTTHSLRRCGKKEFMKQSELRKAIFHIQAVDYWSQAMSFS